ncbi:MAG: aminoacetone oxidase family FAD-binding enzyme, partial [Gemmatimonadaceae bacterium]
ARDVRDGLLALARSRGASVRMDTLVTDVAPGVSGWAVSCAGAQSIEADAVIVACGGLSVPMTGSEGAGLRIAEKLGHTIHQTYAALTPITSTPAPFANLSGISLPVTITATARGRSAAATGGFLFTHGGYSGPSVLDVSHVVVRSRAELDDPRARVTVRWTAHGDAEWTERLKPHGARTAIGALRAEMPDRLASALLASASVPAERVLSELTRDERLRLVEMLVRGVLPWTGDEGYKKAEVMGGGVSLAEIDPRTMESRRCAELYLCGEVLDAFGPIGGYNFLWAWATGRAAGLGAAGARRRE